MRRTKLAHYATKKAAERYAAEIVAAHPNVTRAYPVCAGFYGFHVRVDLGERTALAGRRPAHYETQAKRDFVTAR